MEDSRIGDVAPWLYQAIVEQSPEAFIFADTSGTIRLWNRGAEAIFGYAPAEVLGRSLDVIIPEQLRTAHWTGFRNALATGVTKYAGHVLTTRSMHKDGRRLYVDLSFALVKDNGGSVTGALAIGRDATARYVADKELRARVAQLEKQTATAPAQATGFTAK